MAGKQVRVFIIDTTIKVRWGRKSRLKKKDLRAMRKEMQIIFQDPYASLDPRKTVFQILAEPYQIHHPEMSRDEIYDHVTKLIDCVGLRPEHIAAGSPGEGPEYSVLTSMLAGSETLIEAQREGERILLKQLGFGNLRAGEPVYPVFSPDHINIFREDNGKLIKRALA